VVIIAHQNLDNRPPHRNRSVYESGGQEDRERNTVSFENRERDVKIVRISVIKGNCNPCAVATLAHVAKRFAQGNDGNTAPTQFDYYTFKKVR
jgi:hypothetical protein